MTVNDDRNVFMVIGLGFGDEGKGSVTDFLTRLSAADLIIRFNGGPQASHHVVAPDGRMQCFSQFGSGMLVEGVRTFLSRFMLVDPLAILLEEAALKRNGVRNACERLYIDELCLIVTPFHKIINRMNVLAQTDGQCSSCGRGIGETVLDGTVLGKAAIRAADLLNVKALREKLAFLWHMRRDRAEQIAEQTRDHRNHQHIQQLLSRIAAPDYPQRIADAFTDFIHSSGVHIVDELWLAKTLAKKRRTIMEGAQGVLLDPRYGFWPFVTPTRTTFIQAEELLVNCHYDGPVSKIGVLRAYATRHGAGPFITEDAGLSRQLPEEHNIPNQWQGPMRIGWFDAVAARYAIAVSKPDFLALTCIDRLRALDSVKICTQYQSEGTAPQDTGTYNDEKFFIQNILDSNGSENDPEKDPAPSDIDRRQQEHLIELLNSSTSKPLYRRFPGTPGTSLWDEEYVECIEHFIGMPIGILSHGPTSLDKGGMGTDKF